MLANNLLSLAAQFPKEDIHWRAQTVTKDGKKALALAYLDARDVMDRLDAVCGIDGWQSEHYDCGGGRMGCKIGILVSEYIAKPVEEQLASSVRTTLVQAWVWKSDGAGGTDVEADKGAFSDALKRAAVSWGIGRYLYGLGNTYVPCESKDTGQKDNWGNVKWRFVKFTEDPWKYVKGSGKLTWRGPLQKRQLKDAMTELSAKMNSDAMNMTGDLEAVKDEYAKVIEQAQTDAPDWWRGYDAKHKELQASLMVGPASADPDNQASYQN